MHATRFVRTAAASAASARVPFTMPVVIPPLSVPFEGIPESIAPHPPSTKVEVSKLANGVTVATAHTANPLASRYGVYVAAGSRDETTETAGAAHFLSKLAFQSTSSRSALRITRELELLGGSASATAGRELLAFEAETVRDKVPAGLELLADAVVNGRRAEHEVHNMAEYVESDVAAFKASPALQAVEEAYAAAFRGNTLGHPLVAPAYAVDGVGSDSVKRFLRSRLAPQNVVVTGVNVDHAHLVDAANKALGSLTGSAASRTAAQYSGGETRVATANNGETHAVLGFKGAALGSQDAVVLGVLQTLLGGNQRSYTGTVGSGASGLLSQNVFNKLASVNTISAFNTSFSDAGLFGVYINAAAADAGAAIKGALETVRGAAQKVSADELTRAKAALKGSIAANRESRAFLASDIAATVLATGKYTATADMLAQVDKITDADVARVAGALLNAPLTLVSVGDLSSVPYLDTLKA